MSHLPTVIAVAALLGLGWAGTASSEPGALSPEADAPAIQRVVGPVRVAACGERYNPAKGQADALKQLKDRAFARGGDGVVKVRFTQVTNTRSPCWHGVEANGLAVIYAR